MMRLPERWPLLLCLALAARASAIELDVEADEIKFPHSRHAKAKVECLTCHEEIYDAKDLNGQFLPLEKKCLECHRKAKESGNCKMCHTEVKLAANWPKRQPHVRINHATHIEKVKEDCSRCHSKLKEPGIDVPISDGHSGCFSCHQPHVQQYQAAQCSTCHVDLKHSGLQPLAEFSHQGNWLKRHMTAARSEGASCASCHEQSSCLDCHAQTAMVPPGVGMQDRPDRSFIHRNDFFSRHMIEAAADPASCRKCHGAQSSRTSCQQCHTALNVSPASVSPRSPHPSGWALRGAGPAFHGDAAARDAVSCQACHDQGAQSNCVQCHRVGGIGGDPHPVSFGGHHTLQEAARTPMCLICHR
jgi:hypothetical protein